MASEIAVSLLGAVQASISVLLTILVGAVASQFGFLTDDAAKRISRLCVEIFLPCLLIVNLGGQLELGLAVRYVPILVWSLFYNIVSLWLGRLAVVLFKLPKWVVPAVAFNNTTSLPLLLLQSLSSTGVLSSLLGVSDDKLDLAKSYFLVCAVVSTTLTFGAGPKVLQGFRDDAPPFLGVIKQAREAIGESFGNGQRRDDEGDGRSDEENRVSGRGDGHHPHSETPHHYGGDPNLGAGHDRNGDEEGTDDGQPDEITPLLPGRVVKWEEGTSRTVVSALRRAYRASPGPLQKVVDATSSFINAPVIAAVIGAIIGLTPPLQRLFFNDSTEGGYFHAWLTTALQNVGDLFVSLQVLVVGARLALALRRMKKGESSGDVPWGALVFVLGVRFVLWSLIGIPTIWALAKHTDLLSPDPMLWFAMMLMPTGPSAMKLLALADVTRMSEESRMSIAKFLTISYPVTPLISFTVVGALQAAGSIERGIVRYCDAMPALGQGVRPV